MLACRQHIHYKNTHTHKHTEVIHNHAYRGLVRAACDEVLPSDFPVWEQHVRKQEFVYACVCM